MSGFKYEWLIDGQNFKNFFKMKFGDDIRSEIFCLPLMLSNKLELITFYLNIYPNGCELDKNRGSVEFYINILDMPKKILYFEMDYTIKYKKMDINKRSKKKFYNKVSWSWKGNPKLKEFKDLKTKYYLNNIKFEIYFKILKIYKDKNKSLPYAREFENNKNVYLPNIHQLNWKLNDDEHDSFLRAKVGKRVKSKYFDVNLNNKYKLHFQMEVYPKGDSKDYANEVWLFLVWDYENDDSIGILYYIISILYIEIYYILYIHRR